ncbi:response regulator [Haloimpatiens sp. FM7315]|uniref:response regulator n=1 Tax=Haloimpatiens sp. FM7315 TaxID=3298609 RepID=UPI0035A28A81
MNILIVEDDISIIKILQRIIFDRNLGNVVSHAQNGIEGMNKINIYNPEIVLVDLLMPGKDGLSLVREIKKKNSKTQFIMISQVTSKDMIAKAYEYGVEYYVNKPINAIEVQNVIKKVVERIQISQTLDQIKGIFSKDINLEKNVGEILINSGDTVKDKEDTKDKIKNLMSKIGIMGEVGCEDIINIVSFLIESSKSMSDYSIKDLCGMFSENPKSVEQRIRRTATVGMVNLANLGIEDYMNEIFTEYSNGIYNFEQIKTEMDHIRGKSRKRGKVNLKKFIHGITFYCEKNN